MPSSSGWEVTLFVYFRNGMKQKFKTIFDLQKEYVTLYQQNQSFCSQLSFTNDSNTVPCSQRDTRNVNLSYYTAAHPCKRTHNDFYKFIYREECLSQVRLEMERQSTLELINTNNNTVSPRQQDVRNTMEIVSVEQKKLPKELKFLRSKFNHEDQTKIEKKTMDLFEVPLYYALAQCVSADMKMSEGIAVTFKEIFGRIEELVNQNRTVEDWQFYR
ncbi:hypothetical protein JTB14_010087 [Gonioctena quinquepunctata]|nr:hypothetical protein JTB14_010087 [Gonioctena quinquepunctata]